MNLLFSIDDMYVDHFKVMLYSLVRQTKNRKLEIYVLQKTLLKRHTELIQYTQNLEVGYHPIIVVPKYLLRHLQLIAIQIQYIIDFWLINFYLRP